VDTKQLDDGIDHTFVAVGGCMLLSSSPAEPIPKYNGHALAERLILLWESA